MSHFVQKLIPNQVFHFLQHVDSKRDPVAPPVKDSVKIVEGDIMLSEPEEVSISNTNITNQQQLLSPEFSIVTQKLVLNTRAAIVYNLVSISQHKSA